MHFAKTLVVKIRVTSLFNSDVLEPVEHNQRLLRKIEDQITSQACKTKFLMDAMTATWKRDFPSLVRKLGNQCNW